MKLNKMASCCEFLEQMPTKELDKLLQAELQKETVDDDLVRQILNVLESREMDYPIEYNEEIIEAAQKLENIGVKPSQRVKYPRILKAASILLLVGLLLFALPSAAKAENLFEWLARWTDSVFEFFIPEEPNDQPEYVFETDNPGLQQVYDAVVELGVTDPIVPMWLPEEYELVKMMVDEWPAETTLRASFINEKQRALLITIVVQNEAIPFQLSKDTQNVEECEIAGIKHYILSNNKELVITWISKNIECIIATDCQEDVYKILKSIYAMEVY